MGEIQLAGGIVDFGEAEPGDLKRVILERSLPMHASDEFLHGVPDSPAGGLIIRRLGHQGLRGDRLSTSARLKSQWGDLLGVWMRIFMDSVEVVEPVIEMEDCGEVSSKRGKVEI